MLLTLAAISLLVFIIINLPPGNYISNQIAELQSSGESAGVEKARALMAQYSLDKPLWQQYLIWVGLAPGPDGFDGLLQGNLGWSFELERPVAEVVGELAGLTALVNFAALVFVYVTGSRQPPEQTAVTERARPVRVVPLEPVPFVPTVV
ncbi:MAG: hypothetical protein AAFZ09_15435, partial [Pseudomonadota bacterium]